MTRPPEVAIVGGGPVGLLLARLLVLGGARVTVFERRASPCSHSAAIGITPPSLRILRKAGLLEDFLAAGVRVRECFVHGRRGRIGTVSFRHIPDEHRFVLSLPQADTVALLRRSLPKGVLVDGCEVTGVRQVRDGCMVSTPQGERAFDWVAGCDGFRGPTRTFAGIPAQVRPYGCHFVMADFVDRTELGDEAHLFFRPEGSVESFPLPGGLRRWVVQTADHLSEPPSDTVVRLTRERTGFALSEADQSQLSPFTPHRYHCPRYREGRIVLCGDAAHGMSPIGGQGMNSGFADAEFLARALLDAEPAAILPAYERCRRRAVRTAMFRAEWGMALGTLRGRVGAAARDFILGGLLSRWPFASRMGAFYAMLTIPYATLDHVSEEALRS
ncbi:MAG: FAD-dependent oxidoreductase [Opitutales bacterium]|jgi:2-polyprenyl-6-methoxyphenol hydroxylase-like FAD-dependent oxidoreductase